MEIEIDVKLLKLGLALLVPIIVYLIGSFITYRPHAILAALASFFLSISFFVFSEAQEKEGNES